MTKSQIKIKQEDYCRALVRLQSALQKKNWILMVFIWMLSFIALSFPLSWHGN